MPNTGTAELTAGSKTLPQQISDLECSINLALHQSGVTRQTEQRLSFSTT